VGKVKNRSSEDADVVPVKLVVDDTEIETVEKPIRAGNATQFSYTVPMPASGILTGYLELPADAIAQDNRRYFVWSPPAKHDVTLMSAQTSAVRDSANPETWPTAWFIERGLPAGGEWPFATETAAPAAFADSLQRPRGKPDAVIVCNTGGLAAGELAQVRDFVSGGGSALVLLDTADDTARAFAASIGLEIQGMRFESPSKAKYELLTWVGLSHPVFTGFQGHLYNDFSSLRFHQYVELAVPTTDAAQVLARFESGAPAMLEIAVGEGALIVWPFSARLNATNLPKSSRFVPLLYETMRHLCRVEESESAWQVGDILRERDLMFDDAGQGRVRLPEVGERAVTPGDALRLQHAGIVSISVPAGSDTRLEAVNVKARESDLTGMDAAEFELKLASSPRFFEEASAAMAGDAQEASVAREYGILLMALVVGGLLFESWYMARLTAQRRTE
jgi:hypothetical protein